MLLFDLRLSGRAQVKLVVGHTRQVARAPRNVVDLWSLSSQIRVGDGRYNNCVRKDRTRLHVRLQATFCGILCIRQVAMHWQDNGKKTCQPPRKRRRTTSLPMPELAPASQQLKFTFFHTCSHSLSLSCCRHSYARASTKTAIVV
jgi:hypothetical protein